MANMKGFAFPRPSIAPMRGQMRASGFALAAIAFAVAERPEAHSPPEPVPASALYVSTHGDDRNDGYSSATPLRSIASAITRAEPGTTVYIEKGRYPERLITQRAGAKGAEIIITSLNGVAVIDGSGLRLPTDANQNEALVELRHPFVKLVGVEIANSGGTGILLDADDLTVADCHIVDTQLHGISTDTSRQTMAETGSRSMIRRVVIRGNLIERTVLGGSGQAISLIADGFVISGNTIRNNIREGIDIWLGAREGEVIGNTVYGNGAAGIFVDGAAHIKIERNSVYHNQSGIGIASEDPRYETHDIAIFNNVLYTNRDAALFVWENLRQPSHYGVQNVIFAHNTSIGSINTFYMIGKRNRIKILNNLGYSTGGSVRNLSNSSSVVAQGNVWLGKVEGFVAPDVGDFRLNATSPAIDKGVVIPPITDDRGATFRIAEDFSGFARTVGSQPDAGAFEYSVSRDARSKELH